MAYHLICNLQIFLNLTTKKHYQNTRMEMIDLWGCRISERTMGLWVFYSFIIIKKSPSDGGFLESGDRVLPSLLWHSVFNIVKVKNFFK